MYAGTSTGLLLAAGLLLVWTVHTTLSAEADEGHAAKASSKGWPPVRQLFKRSEFLWPPVGHDRKRSSTFNLLPFFRKEKRSVADLLPECARIGDDCGPMKWCCEGLTCNYEDLLPPRGNCWIKMD